MTPRLPSVTARRLAEFLEGQGFVRVRQSGSHLTLRRESDGCTVTLPMHTGKDIGRGLLRRILRDAGLSVDDLYRLR
jgi:predicted RNA binding protein YcfA (HicA-like mRNA interferase family)